MDVCLPTYVGTVLRRDELDGDSDDDVDEDALRRQNRLEMVTVLLYRNIFSLMLYGSVVLH